MNKVSILIPCYNAAPFISEALLSAIGQDYQDKEIIVIDDGSSDESLSVLREFERSIKLIHRENKGGNFTRNELLHLATGEWIQYLDADDYLAKGKLTEQMTWIEANPEWDVVYGPVTLVYDNGKGRRLEKQEVIFPNDPWSAMVSWELPQTASPIFRKSALVDVGGWNNNQKVCQEHELYLRLLKSGKKFIGIPEFQHLVHYRLWSDKTVSTRDPTYTYLTRMRLMEDAYHFMESVQLLTPERKEVFMEWCILVARACWLLNPKEARLFFARNKDIYPLGSIRSKFLKLRYQLFVKWFGFNTTEKLASLLR